MHPVLAETLTEAGADALPAPTPGSTLPWIVLALAAGYGLYRLSKLDVLRRFRPYILTSLLVLWGLAGIEATFALAYALTAHHWFVLGLSMLAFVVFANLEWFRNLMAGVAIAFEDRFEVGNAVRIDDTEGEILSFGLRATQLRGNDGQLHDIPNGVFISDSVANLNGEGDCACDLTVEIPEHLSIDEARNIACRAAILTPLASPRHEPDVFVTRDEPGAAHPQLRIRGWTFDPSYQDHYRSAVLDAWHRNTAE